MGYSALGGASSIEEKMGQRLCILRHLAGLTREHLAQAAGMAGHLLEKCEAGQERMAPADVLAVCAVLGVGVAELMPTSWSAFVTAR